MRFTYKEIDLIDLQTQTINGRRHYITPVGYLPSITSVLSILSEDSISAWKNRVGEKEANKISGMASRRGTRVHEIFENYLNNKEITGLLPCDKESFVNTKRYLDENIGVVYAQEAALYSEYLGVAGRVDCIAEWNGKLSVIDFKTSSKPKKKEWIGNYFQQTSAYCVMFEEMYKIPVDQIVIVVAVSGDTPQTQIFVEKRDDHIWDCIDTIKLYKSKNN